MSVIKLISKIVPDGEYQSFCDVQTLQYLHVGWSCANMPVDSNDVEIVFDKESLHHVYQPQITPKVRESGIRIKVNQKQ